MAEKAREAWLKAFPEMILHLECTPDYNNPGNYRTKTWTGFERGNCISTEILNTEFQSTSGDGASIVLWDCYKEQIQTVNFIHDELLNEIRITTKEQMMKELYHIGDIMVSSMKKVIENVNIKVESSFMTRWFKEAEPVLDESGCLMVMTGIGSDLKPHYEPLETIIELEKRRTA